MGDQGEGCDVYNSDTCKNIKQKLIGIGAPIAHNWAGKTGHLRFLAISTCDTLLFFPLGGYRECLVIIFKSGLMLVD